MSSSIWSYTKWMIVDRFCRNKRHIEKKKKKENKTWQGHKTIGTNEDLLIGIAVTAPKFGRNYLVFIRLRKSGLEN